MKLSKSDRVRKYLGVHPKATANQVKEALARQGVAISASLASHIKYGVKTGGSRKAQLGKLSTATEVMHDRHIVAPLHPNGLFTIEEVTAAVLAARKLGNFSRLRDLADGLSDVLSRDDK